LALSNPECQNARLNTMETLEDRKKTILQVIVEQYVEQASPVGSRSLQRDAGLEWSASTLRGEMSELEGLGFITHPHTSAGRIPTDKGYRYYVDEIMQPKPLTQEISSLLQGTYEKQFCSAEEIFERTLKVLSSVSHLVGLVWISDQRFKKEDIYLKGLAAIFRQPEFNNSEMTQPALNVLENKSLLQTLMREGLSDAGVKIRIGAHDSEEFLKECTLISIPYRLQGRVMGTIGLLGPKRMHYGQLTNLVSDVASRMNESFERWI